ncbi:MAG: ribonuclease E/G, partial [Paracoccaceae bacterium]|nr:ribonuclease E/G [Paracoccaceae bacterium]
RSRKKKTEDGDQTDVDVSANLDGADSAAEKPTEETSVDAVVTSVADNEPVEVIVEAPTEPVVSPEPEPVLEQADVVEPEQAAEPATEPTPEPAPEVVEVKVDEPPKPKRRGWWSAGK